MSRFMYHGTNNAIGVISLDKCRLRTDFGKGFYLTDSIETAKNWAARRLAAVGGVATVVRYEVSDDVYKLSGRRFETVPSLEWLEFIVMNRKRKSKGAPECEPRHSYNWVSGPIANDKIASVVEDYLTGDITADEAVTLARALPQVFQLSLHTNAALSIINEECVSIRQYISSKWSNDWMLRK